jgi:hypothetical protein
MPRAPGASTHEREHDITHATTEIPLVIETDVTTEISRAVETDAARAPIAEARAPRPVSYGSVPPAVWALARGIAAVLGETLPPPIRTITRVVDRLGPDRARALLGQALTSEASGGLLLPDGRRRTPGGTFLFLVRTAPDLSTDDRASIFPKAGYHARGAGSATPAAATPTPAAPAPVAWTDDTYRTLAQQLQQDVERLTTVKITVIGRPGTAVEQGTAVVLALVSEKVPDLPKGLPEPPAGTRYTVFVARKPWAKVAEALAADPEDAAIIEGYAALDPYVEGIAVYATGATTKRLQAVKRATTTAVP